MKIAILITTMNGGGAERVVANLSNFLLQKGHQVTIAVMRGLTSQYDLNPEVKVWYMSKTYSSSTNQHLTEVLVVNMFLRKLEKYDCLLAFLTVPILLSLLFCQSIQCPLIICERNFPGSYRKLYRYALRFMCNRANGAIFQTEAIRNWYGRFKREVLVIPNAINEDIFKSPYIENYPQVIVNVGRFNPQKNQALLINAYSAIATKYPNSRLIFYGDGELRVKLKEQVIRLGLQNQVIVSSFQKDIIRYLRQAGIFALSSDYEGMPNALLEAMALGLPCIATDCDGGGPRAIIQNGINGILVEKQNTEHMSQALDRLLGDVSLRRRLGRNARQIRINCSYEAIYSQWLSFIQKIVVSSRRS